jgi:hypothetical protein
MGNREIVSELEERFQFLEEDGSAANILLESGRDTAKAGDAPPALIESPMAIRGTETPIPPKKIVATASMTILRCAVARVSSGRLVRQSTHMRQTPVTHQTTKRRRKEHEQDEPALAVVHAAALV